MNPEQSAKLNRLYGNVSPAQFFGTRDITVVPFPRSSGLKNVQDYDADVVRSSMNQNPPELVDIDPRTLHATQPSVTKGGVDYYSGGGTYDTHGETYADQGKKSNQFPIVYSRTDPRGVTENIILSGHHRATAALLSGNPLRALNPQGGYGPPR